MESNTKYPGTVGYDATEGKVINVGQLYKFLLRIKDGRKRRGIRYQIATVLVLFILAKMCGQNKVSGIADWSQQRREFLLEALGLKYQRLPHHSMYRRF